MSKFIKISALAIAGCLFGASLFAADTTMEPSGIGLPSGKPARGFAIPVKGSSAYSWPFVMKSGDIMTTSTTSVLPGLLRLRNTSTTGGGQAIYQKFQNNFTGFDDLDGTLVGLLPSNVFIIINLETGAQPYIRTDAENADVAGVQNVIYTANEPNVFNLENGSNGNSAFSAITASSEASAQQAGVVAFSSAFADADVAGTALVGSEGLSLQIHNPNLIYQSVGGGATGELDPANRKVFINTGGMGFVPSATQAVTAASYTVLADASLIFLNPDADYVLTSAPTIANGTTGQIVVIMLPAGETNTVTLQSQGILASSNVILGNDYRTLNDEAALVLQYDGSNWREIEFTRRDTASANTTDATPSPLKAISTVSDHTYTVEVGVRARRTGGAAGAAGDGAGYKLFGTFKNIAGTITQIGATTVIAAHESQAGWDCDFTVATNVVTITVTGAVDNNVTWNVEYNVKAEDF